MGWGKGGGVRKRKERKGGVVIWKPKSCAVFPELLDPMKTACLRIGERSLTPKSAPEREPLKSRCGRKKTWVRHAIETHDAPDNEARAPYES